MKCYPVIQTLSAEGRLQVITVEGLSGQFLIPRVCGLIGLYFSYKFN